MTECMPISAPPPNFDLSGKVGTSGRAVGPELSIRDNDGAELPTGAIGNISIRGPPCFTGYEDPAVRNGPIIAMVRERKCGHFAGAFSTSEPAPYCDINRLLVAALLERLVSVNTQAPISQ
jgi:acyl-CoA synthetase (AMP-forming)/AMP-acid ligase II